MTEYNPDIHHRRSIRLKNYDYLQSGLYFITICTQNFECFFGKIVDRKLELNAAGNMVEKWCNELQNKFVDIELDNYVIMPNHFHCIIINNGNGNNHKSDIVGANLCVRPVDC